MSRQDSVFEAGASRKPAGPQELTQSRLLTSEIMINAQNRALYLPFADAAAQVLGAGGLGGLGTPACE
jgi:hypothetical protein